MERKGASKYNVNIETIDSLLEESFEVQDLDNFRKQAKKQIETKPEKTIPKLIPGQNLASAEELKQELQKADSTTQISILATLIRKVPESEQPEYIKQRIGLLLENNHLKEAEKDIQLLLGLEPLPSNRMLLARLYLKQNRPELCMIEYLRAGPVETSPDSEELYVHVAQQLNRTQLPHLFFSATNQKSGPLIETKGRVPLKLSTSGTHALLLVSSCTHFSEQCSLMYCNGGCDVLAWGDNMFSQVSNHPKARFDLGLY